MDKISSIVPGSKRVAAVDLNSSQPVRPGAPSFGRPMGTSTGGTKDMMTTAQKAIAEQTRMTEERENLKLQPKIIQDMADKFFMQKSSSARPIEDIDLRLPSEQPIRGGSTTSAEIEAEVDAMEAAAMEGSSTPKEYVPPGTYLNVNV